MTTTPLQQPADNSTAPVPVRPPLSAVWLAGLVIGLLIAGWTIGWLVWRGAIGGGWFVYLCVGLAYPACLALIPTIGRRIPFSPRTRRKFKSNLFTCICASGLLFLIAIRHAEMIVPAAVQFGMTAALLRRNHFSRTKSRRALLKSWIALGFIETVFAWSFTTTIAWVRPWANVVTDSPYSVAIAVAAIAFAVVALYMRAAHPAARRSIAIELLGVAFALTIFIFAALRPFLIGALDFDSKAGFHHWGAIVTTAQMLRQGGRLLWDVPSQYGFLNLELVAALPFKSAWYSLYVLNATVQTAAALILYLMFRSRDKGALNYVFSFFTALSTVFIMQGVDDAMLGSQFWPSTGAFRFIWCYALMGILLAAMKREQAGKSARPLFLWGNVAWLLGCVWSIESAAYSTCIWLPAYAIHLWSEWRKDTRAGVAARAAAAKVIASAVLPAALLATASGIVEVYYRQKHGVGPDWRCYWDYATAAKGGFFALPLDPLGGVWIPIVTIIAASTIAYKWYRQDRIDARLAMVVGAWGLVWVTQSRFIGRAFPGDMDSLLGVNCAAIAALLLVTDRFHPKSYWTYTVKALYVPILAFIFMMPLISPAKLARWVTTTFVAPRHEVDSMLPNMDPDLVALLDTAKIQPTDPVIYYDLNAEPVDPRENPRHLQGIAPIWAPITPIALIDPLPPQRIQVYVGRYLADRKRGGWVIERKSDSFKGSFLPGDISQFCKATAVVENDQYRATHFEYNHAP